MFTSIASTISFPGSTAGFAPLAVGFFGLGTGYLIQGPQELFGFPKREKAVDVTTGIWGFWMPGFMQFVTGVYLWVSLLWFGTLNEKPLYMTALAFTAYGVHWFALGLIRWRGGDQTPSAFMCIAFMSISALGALVFFHAHDAPVGWLFVGLFAVYATELPASLGSALGEKGLGLFHLATGGWLMYLTWAAVLNFTSGFTLPL